MYSSRLVGEMLAVEFNASPDDPRQDQRADKDDENMHAPSSLSGLFRRYFLFGFGSHEHLLCTGTRTAEDGIRSVNLSADARRKTSASLSRAARRMSPTARSLASRTRE